MHFGFHSLWASSSLTVGLKAFPISYYVPKVIDFVPSEDFLLPSAIFSVIVNLHSFSSCNGFIEPIDGFSRNQLEAAYTFYVQICRPRSLSQYHSEVPWEKTCTFSDTNTISKCSPSDAAICKVGTTDAQFDILTSCLMSSVEIESQVVTLREATRGSPCVLYFLMLQYLLGRKHYSSKLATSLHTLESNHWSDHQWMLDVPSISLQLSCTTLFPVLFTTSHFLRICNGTLQILHKPNVTTRPPVNQHIIWLCRACWCQ